MEITTFLVQLCEHCGLNKDDVKVEVEQLEDRVNIKLSIPEEDSGIFIGHHGESIDGIQRVTRLVFKDEFGDKRMSLNINDYREKREDKLKDLTYSIANRVLDTGEEQGFSSYLPAHERYIVHSTLAQEDGFKELESISSGVGRDRKLVIRMKQEKTQE